MPHRWPDGRWSYASPNNRKIDAVGDERKALRHSCEEWLSERLPGFFASLRSERGYPTCEFISLLHQRPFERAQGERPSNFLWILRMESDSDAWESTQLPGLRFGTAFARDDEPFAWILSGRWPDMFADEQSQKGWGGRTRAGIVSRVEETTFGIFHCWPSGLVSLSSGAS